MKRLSAAKALREIQSFHQRLSNGGSWIQDGPIEGLRRLADEASLVLSGVPDLFSKDSALPSRNYRIRSNLLIMRREISLLGRFLANIDGLSESDRARVFASFEEVQSIFPQMLEEAGDSSFAPIQMQGFVDGSNAKQIFENLLTTLRNWAERLESQIQNPLEPPLKKN